MIHALDPTAATFIAIGYLWFVVSYRMATTAAGRASRAGQAMFYLQVVFVLCTFTSYAIQFFPEELQWLRPIEGWLLAVAALGLGISGCGTRLGRAMNYEKMLHELDAANEKIKTLETTQPR